MRVSKARRIEYLERRVEKLEDKIRSIEYEALPEETKEQMREMSKAARNMTPAERHAREWSQFLDQKNATIAQPMPNMGGYKPAGEY